ncbi:MAG TPA: glycosyltransferase family 39 protein [Angustibacter sp.]|nr:glycosyltransferase family 39 protein [Angustibacter sp.]
MTAATTAAPSPRLRSQARLAWPAYAVAAGTTTLLLALAGRYGPHRDELYFVAAGRHLQWGYPDQPPLTPLIARLADTVAPGSLLALRLQPALAIGVVVLLVAGLARQLGGGSGAQLLAALATGGGAGVLAVGHLLSTSTTDLLVWTAVIRLTVTALQRNDSRWWLAVGAALGVGLENKHLVAFLAAGLVIGIVATPSLRHHLRSPWAWGGALLAVALWAPNLWWQQAHGWPQLELGADVRAEYGTLGGAAMLVGFQLILLGPVASVLVVRGLRGGLRRREWTAVRPVAIAYLVLVPAFVLLGGKHYYLLGLLPPLAAIGAVATAGRRSARELARFAAVLGLTALLPLPALLPVLPPRTLDASFYPALNEDGMETIGWPRVVASVRDVVQSLPAEQRSRAVVVTSNYGEAGALEWYGVPAPVFSGHNGYGDWGPPASSGPVVYVGPRAPSADALSSCRFAATLDTGVDNEEDGHGVWVCDGPRGSWARAWPRIRHLDA